MFTGIVQELGEIRERVPSGKSLRFSLRAPWLAEQLQVGDSVACDGVCLTVERVLPQGFSVCAVPETLSRTTLGQWKRGDSVNLEPSLKPQSPLGGHIVYGHVDGVAEVIEAKSLAGAGMDLSVRVPLECTGYCVHKGALALAGVSLTIAAVESDVLRFAIVPHTLEETNLSSARPGMRLNFEVDILAKYVERLLLLRSGSGSSVLPLDPRASAALSAQTLEKWGYGVR